MSKFLKLVSENTPGAQNAYTVTLTDPDGGVVTQFKVTGTNFAFDNFQEFKAKMLGEEEGEIPAAVEDNQGVATASATSKRNIDDAVGRIADKASSGVGGLVGKLVGTSGQKAKKAIKDREKVNKKAIPVYIKATKEIENALTRAAK